MGNNSAFFLFTLVDRQYALELDVVERVLHAAEITPVDNAPAYVAGLINIGGEILPVIDTRHLFNLQHKELDLSDKFIIISRNKRKVVLLVDTVHDVTVLQDNAVRWPGPGNSHAYDDTALKTARVLRVSDDIVVIHDVEHLFDLQKNQDLAVALQAGDEALEEG
ncbi:chemotaxis protein CheW [Desulfonatronovibrio magnus]|uniref:chemotaxis protein CheW n=1 Tax=Desulfonatronovibrio magnus TaxID=698827 RepID=UPI0012F734C4|nr:chemotaxis protein CheW [Desulfonatronovibrio magnus]